MKKHMFDVKLYREGLRQLQVPAIFFLIINALTGLLTTVGRVVDLAHYPTLDSMLPLSSGGLSLQPIIFSVFIVAAPVLTLRAFHFTTERKSSDFYHAIPQSRVCVFTSFFAAVASHLAIISFGSMLVSYVTTLCFPGYFNPNFGELMVFCFSMLVAGLYVATVTACAMAISGTGFSNLMAALLICFAPRGILMFFSALVAESTQLISIAHLPFPLNYQINLVTAVIFGGMSGNGAEMIRSLHSFSSIFYTLGASLLMGALAAFLFHKRKSEAAESPAVSRTAGAIIRLTLSFIVAMFAVNILYMSHHRSLDSMELFGVLVLLLIAAIVFFLYELLASRRMAALKEALPSLLVLPLLCLLALGGLHLAENRVRAFQPKAEEISHVRLLNLNGYNWNYETVDYFDDAVKRLRFDDPQLLTLISKCLKRGSSGDSERYERLTRTMTVGVKTRGQERFRIIYLQAQEEEEILRLLSANAAYQAIYTKLPSAETSGNYCTITNWNDMKPLPSQNYQKDLLGCYQIMRQEAEKLPLEEWVDILRNTEDLPRLTLHIRDRGTDMHLRIPFTPRLPESYARYMSILEQASANQREIIIQRIRQMNWGDIQMSIISDEGENLRAYWYVTEDAQNDPEFLDKLEGYGNISKDMTAKLADMLEGIKNNPLKPGAFTICLQIQDYTAIYDDWLVVWFSSEHLPELLQPLYEREEEEMWEETVVYP